MVARVPLDGVEEREDLALVEDPLGEPIVGPWRTDGRADIERREPHPGGEREQRLHHQEAAGTGPRRARERIGVALQVAQVGQPDRLADEGPEGGDVAPVGPNGVGALAVQPQPDELLFGGVGRDRVGAIVGAAAITAGGAGTGSPGIVDPIYC
jgi:hypothetical protein